MDVSPSQRKSINHQGEEIQQDAISGESCPSIPVSEVNDVGFCYPSIDL